jgi:uncharacterized protein
MRQLPIQLPKERLAALCRRYGVSRLSLFGSVLQEDFSDASDIDVLVEFPLGQTPSLLELGGLQQELCEIFGREVDLKTPGFLSRYFRDRVVADAVMQYAA